MTETDTSLDRFFVNNGSFEEAVTEYLKYCQSRSEMRQAINHLIEHRELLRDSQIAQLEAQAAGLLKTLQSVEREEVLEEIRSFKDILALHRRLVEINGSGFN